jgi:hypothetical protein
VQALLASSNWNNGSNAGPGYLNSNNVTGDSNHNIGTRLSSGRVRREPAKEQLRDLTHRVEQSILKVVLVGTTESSAFIPALETPA